MGRTLWPRTGRGNVRIALLIISYVWGNAHALSREAVRAPFRGRSKNCPWSQGCHTARGKRPRALCEQLGDWESVRTLFEEVSAPIQGWRHGHPTSATYPENPFAYIGGTQWPRAVQGNVCAVQWSKDCSRTAGGGAVRAFFGGRSGLCAEDYALFRDGTPRCSGTLGVCVAKDSALFRGNARTLCGDGSDA